MYQALYRKWRPRTFDDVVGQSHITETLKRQVAEGHTSHAYLFTGTRGTGKTTCAKILARAINCEHPVNGNPCNACPACLGIESGAVMDVLELDAASNNSVDQVRALRDEAVYSPSAVRKRVYIVDEVHMLSNSAFNALLKILEEPPEHLMFILATTELHKVLPTIRSRCQQFAFKRISAGDIAARLRYVAGEESIPLTEEGAALLARLADGGMRDALSLLDQCAVGAGGTLGEQEILNSLGLAGNLETAALLEEIGRRDTGAVLSRVDRLYAAGKDVGSLLNELAALCRDLLIRKTAPRGGTGLLTGGYDGQTLRTLDQELTTPRLAQMLGRLQTVGADLSRSANRRVDAELCLIRLCDEALDDSTAGLAARLAKLETALENGLTPTSVKEKDLTDKSARQSPPAPPVTEAGEPDLPPWEEAETAPEPPAPDPAPEEAPAAAPAAAAEERASHPAPSEQGGVPEGFWRGLVASLKDKVPMGAYMYLVNPTMVTGRIDGGQLVLWASTDFIRDMVNKQGVLTLVEQAAGALPGAPYQAVVKVGTPPETTEHDRLDDLLAIGQQFGNIITEE